MGNGFFTRRLLVLGAAALPVAGCNSPFTQHRTTAVASYTERLYRWLQSSGRDANLAPEALALMGLVNGGRDIPARQIGENGPDGRYAVAVISFRSFNEFIFQRRTGDVIIIHHADLRFTRLSSVRYPRNGKPTLILDQALAESDYQQQIAFWFERMPGR
jgi:hypothetical protein